MSWPPPGSQHANATAVQSLQRPRRAASTLLSVPGHVQRAPPPPSVGTEGCQAATHHCTDGSRVPRGLPRAAALDRGGSGWLRRRPRGPLIRVRDPGQTISSTMKLKDEMVRPGSRTRTRGPRGGRRSHPEPPLSSAAAPGRPRRGHFGNPYGTFTETFFLAKDFIKKKPKFPEK